MSYVMTVAAAEKGCRTLYATSWSGRDKFMSPVLEKAIVQAFSARDAARVGDQVVSVTPQHVPAQVRSGPWSEMPACAQPDWHAD